MRDPVDTPWNRALGEQASAAAELAPSIDFGMLAGIFDDFLDVVGLPVAIIDLEGRVLASSRWQRLCVEFHRVNPGTLTRCLTSDVELSRQMAEGASYALYRCRNGLTDCATPIVIEGVHVANLFVGQFLLEAPDIEAFRQQQEEFGFAEEPYFRALAEVPIVAEDRLPAILRLVGGLAQQIARQSLAERRALAAYTVVEQQVADRTRELRASHERLQKIAAQVPGVVYQFLRRADGSFAVPYASDALAALFGVAPEAVRDDAAAIFTAVHEEDLSPLLGMIHESAAKLSPWRYEFRVRRPDGGVRWVFGDALPQRLADGGVLWHGFVTDSTERKRTEQLLQARLRLGGMLSNCTLHDLLVATLDEVCAITGSTIGFYHFLEEDQATLSLQAWSTRTTREFCRASPDSRHYDVADAGVWADCVRLGRSVVYNDYEALPGRKGMPEGHAKVSRLMSVPIMRDGVIKAILGLGNKPTDFDDDDLAIVETLADMAWDLTERKRGDAALAERTALVQRRYEALRALNDIAALPLGAADGLLTQALALGARHLGLPMGIISRVDGEAYTVLHHHAPPGVDLCDGKVFPLGATYCALTMEAADVVAIDHMATSDHAGHPCYRAFGLEAYVAAPLMVDGRRFGTVNFTSPQRYPRRFDEGDLEFMRLLARWIGTVLERERAEAEIRAAKETAEERAAQLANSNAELEQFAYVASHDLRQPLRMVNSYVTLLERRYADRLDDDARDFIRYACEGARQMDKLILDLLEYSRIGRHGQADERIDLAATAAEACRLLQLLIEETGCTVTMDGGPAQVIGNGTELLRLFQNLIGNAIKYRSPDRPPRVELRWRRDDRAWLVSVADNGIGIAPEHHHEIFKLFRRLHSSSEYEGTGIGLAVCQKIVKHLGGQISVESEPGRGSTFLIRLPAA